MKITRTAYVARTAHDQTHGNKLVLPEFGVIELRLKKGAAAESKSYLPQTSTPRRTPKTTGDDKFCFAPGTQWKEDTWTEDPAKKDPVKVWYHLFNPFSTITEAKLELFHRFEKKAFWERVLEKDELFDGEHELEFDPKGDGVKVKEWDGALGKESAEFPDGFVTTEHSPYKLRLTVKGEGICLSPVVWTHFHILIEKLELEWGVPEAIKSKDAAKRLPFKDLKTKWTKPTDGTAGTPARIHLLSNVYKTSLAQMDNNTFFTSYKTLWEDGPEIPVFAKVWVRDSGGVKVIAPKALGNTKFLWDWESKLEAPANAFVKNAQDYYKATTKPTGQNCHKDRGGKRADDTKFVFPKQDGYAATDSLTDGAFPFEVKPVDKTRKWAAYSKAWRKGKLAGKTGALFQPARMAGDMYKITVYAAHELKDATKAIRLDVDTDAPLKIDDKLKAEGGIWQVWRKTHLSRYVRKTAAMAKFFPGNVAGTAAHYAQAFVEMVDKIDAANSYTIADHKLSGGAAPDYNQICKDLLTASANVFFTSNLATDAAADHKSESSMILSRKYIDFVQQAHLKVNAGVAAAAGDFAAAATGWGKTVDQIRKGLGAWPDVTTLAAAATPAAIARIRATQVWLVAKAVATSNAYCGTLDNLFFNFGQPMANKLELVKGSKGGSAANPGVITMEFEYTHTFLRDQNKAGAGLGYWYGAAIDPSDADEKRCVIMFWLAGLTEFSHEAGHHFFMPHAQSADGTRPGGTRDDRHDSGDTACMMSYTPVRPGFCGLCQLRMRGWTAAALDKTSATNTKP